MRGKEKNWAIGRDYAKRSLSLVIRGVLRRTVICHQSLVIGKDPEEIVKISSCPPFKELSLVEIKCLEV